MEITYPLVYVSDQPHLPGEADLSDAPEQVHQVHGLCDLHSLQLCLQSAKWYCFDGEDWYDLYTDYK